MKNRHTQPSRFRPHPYLFIALCTAFAAAVGHALLGLIFGLLVVLLSNLQD